jgi:hypothetical protein
VAVMANAPPNPQYNVARAGSSPVRVAAHQRWKMFYRFMLDTGVTRGEHILDVDVTSDRSYEASNYLDAWYPHKKEVTVVGLDDASFLCDQYPGMRFVIADGLRLPFQDQTFDVVHSSAVIEHVGSWARQYAFVAECCRVARCAVFITTPNRWFPVEFHTVLPLVQAPEADLPFSDARHRPRLLRGGAQSQSHDLSDSLCRRISKSRFRAQSVQRVAGRMA